MIITQTPFRMSFFGGGTGFSYFYNEHGGADLSTTFDKYAYVTVRHLPPFFDYRTHITYSAEKDFNIDLSKSCMIGDSENDIEAGKRAGCRESFMVANGLLECVEDNLRF